jgi:hypothetical protein
VPFREFFLEFESDSDKRSSYKFKLKAIALGLMRQNIKLDVIAQFRSISPTLSEILYNTALVWQRDRFSRNKASLAYEKAILYKCLMEVSPANWYVMLL